MVRHESPDEWPAERRCGVNCLYLTVDHELACMAHSQEDMREDPAGWYCAVCEAERHADARAECDEDEDEDGDA